MNKQKWMGNFRGKYSKFQFDFIVVALFRAGVSSFWPMSQMWPMQRFELGLPRFDLASSSFQQHAESMV